MTTETLYQLFLEHPRVCTDSRNILPGSIFFALKGDHFNGNEFASGALESGAAFAVIDEPAFQKDDRHLLVKDALESLQQLAACHRKKFSIPVLAVTGTNGKTTTKELMREVLAKRYRVVATGGNLNNHIGVPLTLLQIDTETEIAVIEMGANHPGEIDFLCRIADPGYGLITNIGKAHLEGFNGFEGVVRTKTELFRYIRERKGMVFLNADDPLLTEHSEGLQRFTYGLSGRAEVTGSVTKSLPSVSMEFRSGKGSWKVDSKLFGSYNALNILAAASVGIFFKVDPALIREAIENYAPANNRSQVKESGRNLLVMDAYNANPDSMRLAIENFTASAFADKMVILGDMLELGKETDAEHNAILELLAEKKLEKVYLVGPVFTRLNVKREWHCFQDSDLARLWFEHHQPEGASILVKGSRGMKLEKVMEVL